MPVKTIPEGYHTVTPYLFLKNAAQAIKAPQGNCALLFFSSNPEYVAFVRRRFTHLKIFEVTGETRAYCPLFQLRKPFR
jgi:hypothetical protein